MFTFVDLRLLPDQAGHLGHRGTVDVGVEYAHLVAGVDMLHGVGSVHRHQRLAHAAFGRGDEQNLLDARDGQLLGQLSLYLSAQMPLGLGKLQKGTMLGHLRQSMM